MKVLILGVAFIAMLNISTTALAEAVTVRASENDGIARIVFTWPTPVPFVSRIQNRQLIIQFSKPAEGDFSGIARRLSKYIRAPKIQNGGRTFVFPLQGDFDLNYFSRGRTVVIEIVDPNPPEEPAPVQKAAKPVTPKEPPPTSVTSAPKSDSAPNNVSERVSVRTGAHPTFGRIEFDWKKRVDYKVQKSGNLASITFQRPANIDVTPLNRKRLANVAGASSQIGGNSTSVHISVASTSRLKHFRSGSKIVVDVINPSGRNDAPPIAQIVPTISNQQPTQSAKSPAPSPQKPEQQQASKSAPVPAPEKSPQQAPTSEDKPVSLTPPNAVPQDQSTPVPAAETVARDATNVRAVTLRLDWNAPVAAAVFRRAGNLWLIFDKPEKINVAKLKTQGGNAIRSIIQVPSKRATILRIVTVNGINPSLRRDGLAWIFDFKKQILQPQTPIEVKSQPSSPAGARLFVSVAESGLAIPLRDPEVGDNLVVVPVIPLAHGIDRNHNYPQMTILASAQGMVIKPNIDDLRVRSIQQGIELSSASKLVLTPLTTKVAANAKLGSIQSMTRIFKPDTWRRMRRQKPGEFYALRVEMLDQLSRTSGKKRQQARMNMAAFLFGNGYSYEAIGVLNVIKSMDPEIETNRQYRLLRGATNFLLGRYDEALKSLDHSSMDGNDEGEFWRAAAMIASGEDVLSAAQFMKDRGSIFRPYPRAVKMEMGMLTTEAAIISGDLKAGIKYLGALA